MPIDLSLTTPPSDALIHIHTKYSPSDSKDVVTKVMLTGLLHGVILDDGHGHKATVGIDGKVDITGWAHSITAQLTGVKTNMNINLTVTTQDPAGATIISSDNEGLRLDPSHAIPVIQKISIDDITHDDIINAVESHQQIIVKGTPLTNVQDGDSVTIHVHGKVFTGVIQGGRFAIAVDGADLAKDHHIEVDINGDKAVHHYGVDTTANVQITSNSHITPAEHHHGFTISGTSDAEDGQIVKIAYGSHQDTATIKGGKWHLNVSQTDAQSLALGKLDITAHVVDKAGNIADNTEYATVDKGNFIPQMSALHSMHTYYGTHLVGEFPTHDKDGNRMHYALLNPNNQGSSTGNGGTLVVHPDGSVEYNALSGYYHHSQTDTFAIKVTDGSGNEAIRYLTLATNSSGYIKYHSEISDVAPSRTIHDEEITDNDQLQHQLDIDLADANHHITQAQQELHDAQLNHNDTTEAQAKLDEFTHIKESILAQTQEHTMPNLDNVENHLKASQDAHIPVSKDTIEIVSTLLDNSAETKHEHLIQAVENQKAKPQVSNPDAPLHTSTNEHHDSDSVLDDKDTPEYVSDAHNHIPDDQDQDDGSGITS
jgi:hypothetical protein